MRILRFAALIGAVFVLCTMLLNSCAAPPVESHTSLSDTELAYALAENAELREHLAYFLENEPSKKVHLKRMTRGFRNKNPMNVVAMGSKNPWLGQIGKDSQGLAVFETWEHGLRAGYRTLKKYHSKGIDTPLKLTQKYCEGDAMLYARHIGKALGIGPTDKFDIMEHVVPLMKSIIIMENGYNPLPDSYFVAFM